jgi:hypothetical protein
MSDKGSRPAERTFALVLAVTALFEGLRAGAGTFRLFIDLPARFDVGPVAFAEFSRATDLSTQGIIFYSVYGFGGAILTAGALWAARRAKAPSRVLTLLGVAFAGAVAVLVLTIQAAPLMWEIGSGPRDAAALAALLDRFVFWTALRIACVDISFVSVIAAMTSIVLTSRAAATLQDG